MARSSTVHVCASCGHEEPRWHGRCPGCAEWNTLVEEAARAGGARPERRERAGAGRAGRRQRARDSAASERNRRTRPGARRRDRSRIGGADRRRAGIGKSTLTNMVLGNWRGRASHALRLRGGIDRADSHSARKRLPERARRARRSPRRKNLETVIRDHRARASRSVRDRLGADARRARADRAARIGRQVREVAARIVGVAKRQQVPRCCSSVHVTKDRAGRAARAGAPRRLPCWPSRVSVSAATARCARPRTLRFDQRGRGCSRCARAGSSSARRLGALRQGGNRRSGQRGARRDGGQPPLLVEVQALVTPSEASCRAPGRQRP